MAIRRRLAKIVSRRDEAPAESGRALVAQWIEHLTTDQKVRGSSPFERAERHRLTAGVVTEEGSAARRGLLSFCPGISDVSNVQSWEVRGVPTWTDGKNTRARP